MRILHVTPYFEHAWGFGGIPRVAAAQVRGLAARGHRVSVATTDAAGGLRRLAPPRPGAPRFAPWSEAGRADGVEVVTCPNLSAWLAWKLQLFLPVGLRTFLRRAAAGFEVAHLHGFHNLPGVLATQALVRAHVPFVLQPNGTAARIERRRAAKAVFDLLLGARVLREAAVVLAVTQAERRQLLGLGVGEERIAVLPNPLETEGDGAPPDRSSFRVERGLGEAPLILYLGQLSPRKRVDLVVRAFASLGRSDARLVVAGPDMGCERRLRRLAAALGLADRALFVGVLEGPDRLAALAAADVVVYPTRLEVFGLVPLEAFLCGTPVVVADDCGCGEIVSRTGGGLVVDGGDVAAVAAAVRRLLEEPTRWREEASRASERARCWFSPELVCGELEALYARLAGGAV